MVTVDLQAYIDAHPTLAAAVTLAAGWLVPTPGHCRRWWLNTADLLKGASMQLKAEELTAAVHDAQRLVKLALAYVPGATPDEKARHITAEVQPLFQAAIAPLDLPGMVNDFAGKLLGWLIAAEVKAADATARADAVGA